MRDDYDRKRWNDPSDLMVNHALKIWHGMLKHLWLSRNVFDSIIILNASTLSAIAIFLQAIQTNNSPQLGIDSEKRVLSSSRIFQLGNTTAQCHKLGVQR